MIYNVIMGSFSFSANFQGFQLQPLCPHLASDKIQDAWSYTSCLGDVISDCEPKISSVYKGLHFRLIQQMYA